MDVLKQIKIFMIKEDHDVEGAAESVGISVDYFRRILNGSVIPGKGKAQAISEWTDGKISIRELMRL